MQAHDDVTEAAVKVASAVAQAILGNMPTVSYSSWSAKAAEPESFDGNRDKKIGAVHLSCLHCSHKIDTFMDERMKILYVLSFMHGGMVQIWVAKILTQFCPECHLSGSLMCSWQI